jgi:starch synthase
MEILHVSAECYPMAKAGGLADVVGALPKYQNQLGHTSKVVMPMHRTPFLLSHTWETVHKAAIYPNGLFIEYTVIKESTNKLGFDLYCVDILGILDRQQIYGYDDDTFRFIVFQFAVVDWLNQWNHQPDVVHVHDYHAGLIPFFMRHCPPYRRLSSIKTVLTIHNAQYQGWMSWNMADWFPEWDVRISGLLEWAGQVNPLAAAIKCSDKVNTVSPTYMKEIVRQANGLEALFNYEIGKCSGILNGIDYAVWNPETDTFILDNFNSSDVEDGKRLNKEHLCKQMDFNPDLPLFVFIGRLVGEKAADLLPEAIARAYNQFGFSFNVYILGSGDPTLEHALFSLQNKCFGFYQSRFEYNEKLSHQLYASADFLLMPSRVEPCGLNQMYAMRYGTIPVVRRTGGLADTVIDHEDWLGVGVCFDQPTVADIVHAIERSLNLFQDKIKMRVLRENMMTINFSWEKSAQDYIDLYHSIYS